MTDFDFDHTVANFSISSKKVIQNFKNLREYDRSFPLIIKWLGFNIGFVEVQHDERKYGKTSYTFKKLMTFAIESIVSQSNKPLLYSVKFGLFLSLLSVFNSNLILVVGLNGLG